MRVAGIMSGTSVDGIDVAIVDIEGEHAAPIAHATVPWSADVRRRILAVSDAPCTTAQISRLSFELGNSTRRPSSRPAGARTSLRVA